MSTWGVAFISLGLLLIAYKNWFGVIVLIFGVLMFFFSRRQKKKAEDAEKAAIEAHKEIKIKSRK
ncbi:hypothetical protein GHI93_11210 [Lactococcus hircilactis]|uniref:Uncharacterized protein n=1 Tax=Lactococcus hircilactis TaxID=1494462 RepID=A0A7X1ZBY1_9LACT|nr:hypothetical protein [Lactococcus hircilactis]MQW40487.1 hypothetical protein [Lactococcus hircilactis]